MILCLKKKLERDNGWRISGKILQKHKKDKEDEKLRKWSAKKKKKCTQMTSSQSNGKNSSPTNNSTRNTSSSFFCKQTLYNSIARTNLQLVKSPNNKAEVTQRLATKYKLKLKLKEN